MTKNMSSAPAGADLYCELWLSSADTSRSWLHAHAPGLIMAIAVSLAAAWIADYYAMPMMLLGLLLGLSMSFVSRDPRIRVGLDFLSQSGLRIGVVLLGTRITTQQFIELGAFPFLLLVLVTAAVLMSSLFAARFLGQDRASALVAGGATAICGASAALALSSLLGERRIGKGRLTSILVSITIASALAMTTYPLLAHSLSLDDQQAGFFIGASVHDVAQAVGGGFSFSKEAGEIATIVKLARVAFLVPLLLIVGVVIARHGKRDGQPKPQFPLFIGAFLLVVVANSFGLFPQFVTKPAATASQVLLAGAIVATALKAQLHLQLESGWRGFSIVAVATATSLTLSLIAAYCI